MKAKVAIVMGSSSDWPVMKLADEICATFKIQTKVEVISAHRTPDRMVEFAKSAKDQGIKVIIAGAGGAAHLPGMIASLTTLPVIGVPVKLKALDGLDSLLSIVQMPKGVPVASMAIDNSANAAYLALRILALSDPQLEVNLQNFSEEQKQRVHEMNQTIS